MNSKKEKFFLAKFDKPFPKDSTCVKVFNLWVYEDESRVPMGHVSLLNPVPRWKQWILKHLMGWRIAWGSEYGGPRTETARGEQALSFCQFTTAQAKDGRLDFQKEDERTCSNCDQDGTHKDYDHCRRNEQTCFNNSLWVPKEGVAPR